jgi:thiol-disulfide isomerase/thioredoxin
MRNEKPGVWEKYMEEFKKISQPVKDSLLKKFVDPVYLQIEVYRDIADNLDLAGANPKHVQVLKDWKKSVELAYRRIKNENDKSVIPAYKKSADSIKTKKYRDILHLLIQDKLKFGNGDPVIDLAVRLPDGSNTTISSLKGKVIYIDLWATWCGPCLAEMPHLEELKKKYADRDDLAIVSLSIDDNDKVWLRNLEQRKPDGIQWRIDRPKLVDYGVESVPRYILIDKNFKIAEMNAPGPSNAESMKLIEKFLANNQKQI